MSPIRMGIDAASSIQSISPQRSDQAKAAGVPHITERLDQQTKRRRIPALIERMKTAFKLEPFLVAGGEAYQELLAAAECAYSPKITAYTERTSASVDSMAAAERQMVTRDKIEKIRRSINHRYHFILDIFRQELSQDVSIDAIYNHYVPNFASKATQRKYADLIVRAVLGHIAKHLNLTSSSAELYEVMHIANRVLEKKVQQHRKYLLHF